MVKMRLKIKALNADIFKAFLDCPTKGYYKILRMGNDSTDILGYDQHIFEDYKQKCLNYLSSCLSDDECLFNASIPQDLEKKEYRLFFNCVVITEETKVRIEAVEQCLPDRKIGSYIPFRFVASEKIKNQDKLMLAFDSLVLSPVLGKLPAYGKIMYGSKFKITKIKLDKFFEETRLLLSELTKIGDCNSPPQLVLNKHCAECEFRLHCRRTALEKDELTLLSGMTPKERRKYHDRGIFTVTQLSHTFRPRKKSKRSATKQIKHYYSLKALAIREHKIFIVGNPQIEIKQNPVFLDVEGIPTYNFYYLIGMRYKRGDSIIQNSFWADDQLQEKNIWIAFVSELEEIEKPQLIYFGRYEKDFLRRMNERYCRVTKNPDYIEQIIQESVNVLSFIYAQIYFPTYSNGLKDIANYLGFKWSEPDLSGAKTLIWRQKWQITNDACLKQKLITYNSEDCVALERVTEAIARLCQNQKIPNLSSEDQILNVDSLTYKNSYHFGRTVFSVPELGYINKAAYWDYQRDKIYVRSSKRLRQVSERRHKSQDIKTLPINRIIKCRPLVSHCPKCSTRKIEKNGWVGRTIYDLKLNESEIKRWIVRYLFRRYLCLQCGSTFQCKYLFRTKSKYGQDLQAYSIYQNIELRMPSLTVTKNLNQSFGYNLQLNIVNHFKSVAAKYYKATHERILQNIVRGNLVHIDETKISVGGKNGFVWVLTNLEEVAYVYSKTRSGKIVLEHLKQFKGVLVSDFYSVYYSIDCPQQKCLIHLIRDLNDDLFKQPFNCELKDLVQEFALLLKPIIKTVDKFGLKTSYLREHKCCVEKFFDKLSKRNYNSEITIKYKKRFAKNRNMLFTFLDYDSVPWNNNNAEHAIKAFATLRKIIKGSTSDNGICDYLVLLSICETCKYKGVSFLEFLRSGYKNLDEFITSENDIANNVRSSLRRRNHDFQDVAI